MQLYRHICLFLYECYFLISTGDTYRYVFGKLRTVSRVHEILGLCDKEAKKMTEQVIIDGIGYYSNTPFRFCHHFTFITLQGCFSLDQFAVSHLS